MLSKYTLKRINYKVFSKKISESYNQPHSKRVAIAIIFLSKIIMLIFRDFFKTQSDQIYTKPHQLTVSYFRKNFLVTYAGPQAPKAYMPVTTVIISI